MGVVWIAHNRVLDVPVALKLSRPGSGPESNRVADRALTEARLAAQLSHPAVCRVIDYGTTEDGEAFVVSELLYGENLAQVLLRKKGSRRFGRCKPCCRFSTHCRLRTSAASCIVTSSRQTFFFREAGTVSGRSCSILASPA